MVLIRFSFTMLDAAVGAFAVASALVAGLLTLLVLLNGGCLAISGTIVQALLRNPLASPKIIGINSGAALAVYLMVIMFPNLSITYLPVAAVMGGCLAASLIYLGAEFGKVSPARLVLIGIAVGQLCDAGVNYILVTSPTFTFSTPLVWLTGSLWARGWAHVGMVWHVLPLLGVASVTLSFRLDLIRLGDAHATGLGMNVRVERFMLMVLAVLLASVSVSVVGVLGFVGLMAPQIARSLMGGDITVS
ncbi:iron ABC transporter permease [Parasedimentitalea marina]|uniref:Iron ABC transporter permease n=2 Tax=Parasedimentitalea marina TaxID=2483033 RepID=A0A3T0N2P2_9RHOB|nr:iron ABC transporter permease [Parasedimentitalea marina]